MHPQSQVSYILSHKSVNSYDGHSNYDFMIVNYDGDSFKMLVTELC